MPWEIQYVPEKETLVVAATGAVSDEEARDLTGRAITLLTENHATRVLGDCCGMQSGPSFGVVYWLAKAYSNPGRAQANQNRGGPRRVAAGSRIRSLLRNGLF